MAFKFYKTSLTCLTNMKNLTIPQSITHQYQENEACGEVELNIEKLLNLAPLIVSGEEKMVRNQYPFWKDQEIAHHQSQEMQYLREIQELKEKLKSIKCPKCGHIFKVE